MKKLFLLLIKVYRWTRPFRPICCRFYPSCSAYAAISLEKHGCIKGLILTVARLLRCHPFNDGGLDEVPEKFEITFSVPTKLEITARPPQG